MQVTRTCLVLQFLAGTFFGIPIMATYYYDIGLTPTEVFIIQSALSVTAVIVEIPTGYPCDRFGAKPVIITGFAGLTMSAVVFWQCRTFWQFVVALVVQSLFWSLISGATSTLIYVIYGLDASRRYDKIAVRAETAGKIVGTAGGAAMVMYGSMSLPLALQPIPYATAVILALTLPRQRSRQFVLSASTMMWKLTKTMLLQKPKTRWTLLFFAVHFAVALSSFWTLQLQLERAGWQVQDYGMFYLSVYASTLGLAWITAPLLRRGVAYQRWVFWSLSCLCIALAGLTEPSIAPWFAATAFSLNTALAAPMVRYQLRAMSSENKLPTTELSVASACSLLVFALLGPIVGKIASALSTKAANLTMSLVLVVFGGGSLLLLRRAGQGK